MEKKIRRRGSELLEFNLVFLPLLMMIGMTVNMAWSIFAQATLQWAVRSAVHSGVIMDSTQLATGACLTDTVKGLVQQNALGLVSGSAGLAKIKVNYYQPPDPSTGGNSIDVSTQSTGNTPGNVMQVSIQGFSLNPLMARIFSWASAPDKSPFTINVYSADIIESPGVNIPCIGTAP